MMTTMLPSRLPLRLGLCLLAVALLGVPALAQDAPPTIEEKTAGMTAISGFVPLYWDERTGHLFAEFAEMEEEFMYSVSAASGLGSNPIGLDRGQISRRAVLMPIRVGPRILLMEPNYRYRAVSDNPDEIRAVRDAFAPSVHWGFEVEAETGGRVLVDMTDFLLRDAHGSAARIARAGQGTFRLDRDRSVFYLENTKGFPDNTEVETMLTFTSDDPGRLVSGVAASGDAVTLRHHHSLVRLPGPGFEIRVADPRIGVNGPTYMDYATPIDQPMTVRLAARHRLQKTDPSAERSEVVEPIVYYLDRGVPEPVRTALLEGARWWAEAFEAAGFIDAYRVEVLPEGADAQDIRYNMIHWTHRRTRGWSYGGGVQDPRTGEIIKGNVNLGSLRLRQDHLLGVGMVTPYGGASGTPPIGLPPDPDGPHSCGLSAAPGFSYLAQVGEGATPLDMALARVAQLSAHEVGHTLGFPHNYMASTYGGRASVMDYPAPLAVLEDGVVKLDDAYGVGVGSYDILSVRWAYGHFPPDETAARLDAIMQEGLMSETRFMAHTDNYIGAGAHPLASVWDNGQDLVRHLGREIEIRQAGLDAFGENVIRPGEAMSLLEPVLVPLYLHHRFQMKAALNTVGGQEYYYAVRGDGQRPVAPIPGERQREALETVLRTLETDFLALPERIVEMIPPPAYRETGGEGFDGHTGLVFDPLAAADTSADYTVELLLHPERMARLVNNHAMDPEQPGLAEVLDRLVEKTWGNAEPDDSYRRMVQDAAERSVLNGMMREAMNPDNPARVRALLEDRLMALGRTLADMGDATAHDTLAVADIRRFADRDESLDPNANRPERPPGSPIGGANASGERRIPGR